MAVVGCRGGPSVGVLVNSNLAKFQLYSSITAKEDNKIGSWYIAILSFGTHFYENWPLLPNKVIKSLIGPFLSSFSLRPCIHLSMRVSVRDSKSFLVSVTKLGYDRSDILGICPKIPLGSFWLILVGCFRLTFIPMCVRLSNIDFKLRVWEFLVSRL